MLYFLVVFVFGGILLLGLATYFGWEVVTRQHRLPWTLRTPREKIAVVLSGLLFAWLLFIPLRMIWVTRLGAIPGAYTSSGVWGTATLTLHPDGTFVEGWHFTNEYNRKFEGQGETHGTWSNGGRDWLTRNIDLQPFRGLAEYARDQIPSITSANVTGYGGVTSIEVDTGADIVFRK